MVKELYQIRRKEITLAVTSGAITSIRKKDILKSGCRVYDNGCIGVAGTLGQPTEDTWKAAEEALDLKIACTGPTTNLVRSRSKGELPEEKAFIEQVESILATLKQEFPRFILSNKVSAWEATTTLQNDAGLCLEETNCKVMVALSVKDEESPNVDDSFIYFISETLDTEKVLDTARQILTAHANLIPMPEGLPLVADIRTVLGGVMSGLDGTDLHKGASIFSGKLGQKLFDEKFNMVINRDDDSDETFFDDEGTTLPGDNIGLIENGVLVRGIADKKCAAEFATELTASADGDYDDIPKMAAVWAMDVTPTGSLDEILGGQDAIYILEANGGDTTPAGDFATPVQTAYLLHNGRLTARLPEFNFGGSIFDLFGDGYLGCIKEKLLGIEHQLVVKGSVR